MGNVVIQVEDLSKMYRLGVIGYGTLKADTRAFIAKLLKKEDPNAQIGKESRFNQSGKFWALRDVNFKIEKGDRIGVIGRNGAGKSTLLKLLSKITAPTEGAIKINGRVASLLEVGTGFHPELTGRENVYLNGAILGMKRSEIKQKFDEIVEFAGVKDFIDTPVKRYSSGMYVRLGFSVAAHLDSDILIVDEVLSVGDAEFQKKCIGKMEDVSKGEGRTILFVSHSLTSVKRLCNKGFLFESGQLGFTGQIDDALEKYTESFPKIVNGQLDTSDEYHVRSTGHIRLLDLLILNANETKTIEIGKKLIVKFKFIVVKPVENLALYFGIKDKAMPSLITNVTHSLMDYHISVDREIEGVIELDTSAIRPGLYPLYFWLGDLESRHALSGARLVADEVIGPINFINGNQAKLNYMEEDESGIFTVKSKVEITKS